MHTAMIIGVGFALLAAFAILGRLSGVRTAAWAMWFVPVWLVGALINMWVGVSHAGYTVAQEAPIALVVFGVPAALAWLIARRGA